MPCNLPHGSPLPRFLYQLHLGVRLERKRSQEARGTGKLGKRPLTALVVAVCWGIMSARTTTRNGGGGRKRHRNAAVASEWQSEVPQTCSYIDKQGKVQVRDVPSFPDHTPLHGLEPRIWAALAHVDPHLFALGKPKGRYKQEPAFREALRRIGMGWVATSNPPDVRTPKGALFDAAKEVHEGNGGMPPAEPLPEIKEVDVEDEEWHCKEVLEFVIVPDDTCTLPANAAQRMKESLEGTGMCVIRGAVDKPTIGMLRSGNANEGCHPDATEIEESGKRVPIQYTNGNGTAGELIYERNGKPIGSYYNGLKRSAYLDRLQDIIVKSLRGENAGEISRKYILLRYANGGENYAHRDDRLEKLFPYQALLMLSNAREYEGGNFYVVRQSAADDGDVKCVRTCSPKLDSGDLVIFQADKRKEFTVTG